MVQEADKETVNVKTNSSKQRKMKVGYKVQRLEWLLEGIRRVIPPNCWHCRQWVRTTQQENQAYPYVCPDCLENLPWADPEYSCAHCGQSTSEPNRLYCQHCIENKLVLLY